MEEVPNEEHKKISNVWESDVLHEIEKEIVVKNQIYAQVLVSFNEVFCQFCHMIHIDQAVILLKNSVKTGNFNKSLNSISTYILQ